MNFSAFMQGPGKLCPCVNTTPFLNYTLIKQLMRISILITIISTCCLQLLLATPILAQSMKTEKIIVGLKNESLLQAVKKIESQSTLRFFYRSADIKNITIQNLNTQSRTVEQTLNEILKNTFLSFRQIDNTILIERNTQMGYEIKGRILDINRYPVSFARLKIRLQNKKEIIGTSMTDTAGNYKLNVLDKGTYLITISAVNMDSLQISISLADRYLVDLKDVILNTKGKNLNEVLVIGKRAYIEQKIDRTVINVGSLISNTGANALEVLEKSPGVIIDANGRISFKGKSGVLVLVDGKQTFLSGNNLAGYLKSLPASALDQIELMDNPPARYDAGGNSGVINIKTKKTQVNGFNGSLSASYTQGYYGQTSESANLNYRSGKFNLFSNIAYNLNKSFRKLDLDRQYFNPDGTPKSSFEQTQYIKPTSEAFNLKLGMDYYRSANTTWGLVLTGLSTPNSLENPSSNNLFDQHAELTKTITGDNYGKGKFSNKGININFSHKLDSVGRTITFDADYLIYNSNTDQRFLNHTFNPSGLLIAENVITSRLPTDIQIYALKTDYTHPMKGKVKLDAGLKSSYVNTDNTANYFNVLNGTSTPDYNLSNEFLYKENINAAYLNFNKGFSRFTFQTGIRLENTNAQGHQLGNILKADSTFANHYTNLFPTAYLSYKLDSAGSNSLILSYGKRIGRPYYQDLNPFVTISDQFTYSSGNPYLRPQFSNNYKISYNYKSYFSTSLYYYYINDLQNEVIRQQGEVFIDGTGNIGKATYYGFSVNASLPLTKWWFFSSYLQVFNNSFKGDLFGNYLDQSSTFGEVNMTSQFTMGKGWSAEVSGFYISRRAGGQFINFATGQLNLGLQKKILNDKASLKLSARDILNTYSADGITNFIPSANSTFINRFFQQSVTFGFNYNFGGKGNSNRRNTGSADVEKGRIKN